MKHDLNNTTITCPLFKKHQAIIITNRNNLNNSVRPIEKSIFAEKIHNTCENMLNCVIYDKLSLDCNSCHSIARMQKKQAEVHFDIKKTA